MEYIRNLQVKALEGKPIEFTPNILNCTLDTSVVSKMTTVVFILQDTRPPEDYIQNIVRKFEGTVVLPNDVAASIYNEGGTFNYPVLNAVLSSLGIQAIEEA